MKKADEILVSWKDREHIIDLIEINPNAGYVLEITDNNLTDKDWEQVYQYYIMTQKKFKVCLSKLNYNYCREKGIPFFFQSAISEPWALNAFIRLGICSARISGELAHNLDYLDTLPIEIRVWPNKTCAPFNYKPIIGGWFRPEDLVNIDAIDICEFDVDNIREEQALYRIYAENHEWPGELYMLVKDIQDKTIYNRMIPPEFQERRSNCRMRCQSGGHCHYCETLTYLANPDLLRPVKEKIDNV